jgi:hypothetical protein
MVITMEKGTPYSQELTVSSEKASGSLLRRRASRLGPGEAGGRTEAQQIPDHGWVSPFFALNFGAGESLGDFWGWPAPHGLFYAVCP